MKKSELRLLIRGIVREEVALTVKEVIKEIVGGGGESTKKSKQKPKQQHYSKNKILNDVLNETAMDDEWKTIGDGIYDSGRVNEVMSSAYSDLKVDDNPNGNLAAEMGVNSSDPGMDFLKKDYRAVMKAIDKKKGSK